VETGTATRVAIQQADRCRPTCDARESGDLGCMECQ
jgi:hypothetical protein